MWQQQRAASREQGARVTEARQSEIRISKFEMRQGHTSNEEGAGSKRKGAKSKAQRAKKLQISKYDIRNPKSKMRSVFSVTRLQRIQRTQEPTSNWQL